MGLAPLSLEQQMKVVMNQLQAGNPGILHLMGVSGIRSNLEEIWNRQTTAEDRTQLRAPSNVPCPPHSRSEADGWFSHHFISLFLPNMAAYHPKGP